MKINKKATPICTDDFWYDLFEGGYIDPCDLLDTGTNEVCKAIGVLEEFKLFLEENEMIEEM